MSAEQQDAATAAAIDAVDGMIGNAARLLGLDLDVGYTPGYEEFLADEVHQRIPESARPEILRWLIGNLVAGITTGAICLLDETDEDTYRLAGEITDELFRAVNQQDRAERMLFHLITHEISDQEHAGRILASLPADGEGSDRD